MPPAPDAALSPDPPDATPSTGDGRFAGAVAAVTAAFGDPTRREIFLHLRTHPGATATEVAAAFSLHPNVARHHLDRLVAGGYLRVDTDRRAGGAGRPSKRFFPCGEDPIIESLTRRDDLLVNLLREALELLGPEEAEAHGGQGRRGLRAGAGRAHVPSEGQRSVKAAMHAIAETFTAHGFAAHAVDHGPPPRWWPSSAPSATPPPPTRCSAPSTGAWSRGCWPGSAATRRRPHASRPVSRARGDDTCAALA